MARSALPQDPAKTPNGNHPDALHFSMMIIHNTKDMNFILFLDQKLTFYVFYCHSHSLPYGVAASFEEEQKKKNLFFNYEIWVGIFQRFFFLAYNFWLPLMLPQYQ